MTMKFFKTKYRIITDKYAGYEAQMKYWYWPFWVMVYGCNTNCSIEQAEKLIQAHRREHDFNPKVVKNIN